MSNIEQKKHEPAYVLSGWSRIILSSKLQTLSGQLYSTDHVWLSNIFTSQETHTHTITHTRPGNRMFLLTSYRSHLCTWRIGTNFVRWKNINMVIGHHKRTAYGCAAAVCSDLSSCPFVLRRLEKE